MTSTPNRSDNKNVAHYILAHEVSKVAKDSRREGVPPHRRMRRVAADRRWEYVRYDVECALGLDESTNKSVDSKIRCRAFVEAYDLTNFECRPFCYGDLSTFEDDHVISSGSVFVVRRRPMPAGFAFYRPMKFTSSTNETNQKSWKNTYDTEEEAMQALVNDTSSVFAIHPGTSVSNCCLKARAPPPGTIHASVFGTPRMPVPRDNKYLCDNCLRPGHFRQFCQQPFRTLPHEVQDNVVLPMPPGIPLSDFCEVDPNTSRGVMYYVSSGGSDKAEGSGDGARRMYQRKTNIN